MEVEEERRRENREVSYLKLLGSFLLLFVPATIPLHASDTALYNRLISPKEWAALLLSTLLSTLHYAAATAFITS